MEATKKKCADSLYGLKINYDAKKEIKEEFEKDLVNVAKKHGYKFDGTGFNMCNSRRDMFFV